MEDIVIMLFMLITRIGLPVLAVVVVGYLIERWYTAHEGASQEEAFSADQEAGAAYEAPVTEDAERRKKVA